MNKITFFASTYCLLSLPLNSYAVNNHQVAVKFFESYQSLYHQHDPKLAELIADQANIVTTIYADGKETNSKITGQKLKSFLADALNYAKVANFKDSFSNVQIKALANQQYQITAEKYSLTKCYTNKDFKLIIAQQPSKQYQIIELHDATIEQALCTQPLQEDLSATLSITANMMNKDLPKRIDRETVLEKVTANKNTLHYQYRYSNLRRDDINTYLLENEFEPMSIQMKCKNKQLMSEMKKGAIFQYTVLSKDSLPIIEFTLDEKTCQHYQAFS